MLTMKPLKALLIEDSPVDAALIKGLLGKAKGPAFEVETADRLTAGLERLARGGVDVVLLDLTLPDSEGLETYVRAHEAAPETPVIVLSGLDDLRLAAKA